MLSLNVLVIIYTEADLFSNEKYTFQKKTLNSNVISVVRTPKQGNLMK